MEKLTVHKYFEYPETVRPMELVYEYVREPAMPNPRHQRIATRLQSLLFMHVERRGSGQVLAPVDVVLDEAAALVVQPDIIFIRHDRLGIIKERIWGPPDLVVEILSPSTARRDRTVKVWWYRKYGVHECWLVDVRTHGMEVIELHSPTPARMFRGPERLRSSVLPDWDIPVEEVFFP